METSYTKISLERVVDISRAANIEYSGDVTTLISPYLPCQEHKISYEKPFNVEFECKFLGSEKDYLILEAKTDDLAQFKIYVCLKNGDKESYRVNLASYNHLSPRWNLFVIPLVDFTLNGYECISASNLRIGGHGSGKLSIRFSALSSQKRETNPYLENPYLTEYMPNRADSTSRAVKILIEQNGRRLIRIDSFHWCNDISHCLMPSDVLIVSRPYYMDLEKAHFEYRAAKYLGIPNKNIFYVCSSKGEMVNAKKIGFQNVFLVSQNFLCETSRFDILPELKVYDAVFNAGFYKLKRHYLAWKVPNLALLKWGGNEIDLKDIPQSVTYVNNKQLTHDEVCIMVNRARTGLCLSAMEGCMRSCVEYLLCGVPIVSTQSYGGREEFFDDYHTIVCKDDPEDVRDSVMKLIEKKCSPQKIREITVQKLEENRQRFLSALEQIKSEFQFSFDNNDITEKCRIIQCFITPKELI